jgi:hypothetical protein
VPLFGRSRDDSDAPVFDRAVDDQELKTAREAAPRQGYEPAKRLLESTSDPERKDLRVEALGAAGVAGRWVDDWFATEPASLDACLLRGIVELMRGWGARGSGYVDTVSELGAEAFAVGLAGAEMYCQRVIEGRPADATPWVWMLTAARGLELPLEELFVRYEQLVARDRWHRFGHNQMVQGLAEKWSGQPGLALDFARRLSAEAPDGEPVHTVLLEAHAEEDVQQIHLGTSSGDYWRDPAVVRDVQLAAARYLDSPARRRSPRELYDRNIFAYCYSQMGDWSKAKAQFSTIGVFASEDFWGLKGDPVKAFGSARKEAMKRGA